MRAGRTNGTTTYSYVYNGSQLTRMTVNDEVLDFTYDANGTPLTVTWNGTVYYYVTNLQGDVLQIRNTEGNLIAQYTYDAWGKLRYIDGALMLCAYNPLLYRGYVFDLETGLYYLQSRYYDPEMGRFINADAFAATGQGLTGNNMFAYCGNNPVMNVDSAGTRYHAVKSLGDKKSKYIFDQTAAPHGTKKFQDVTVGYGGCGVVASYNALITLGNEKEFDEVLAYYNEDPNRTFMRGKLGMLPGQVANYFESLGYRTITTNSVDGIDVLSKQADACIMFYIFPIQQEVCGIGLTLPGAHFVEYKYYSNQYVGRNTSATNGMSYFKYPSDYFYQDGRVYAEAVLIFK